MVLSLLAMALPPVRNITGISTTALPAPITPAAGRAQLQAAIDFARLNGTVVFCAGRLRTRPACGSTSSEATVHGLGYGLAHRDVPPARFPPALFSSAPTVGEAARTGTATAAAWGTEIREGGLSIASVRWGQPDHPAAERLILFQTELLR